MPPLWLDVLDETIRLCAAHSRHDLSETLRQKRIQLTDPILRVLVVGRPKQGKSQLINALLNAPVRPVGDGATYAAPAAVPHPDEQMVFIDTPGVEGQLDGVTDADVAILVSDATRELSNAELAMLTQLAKTHARIVVAMSKTDIAPHWRQMVERNRHRLLEARVPAVLAPVSATLWMRAAYAESGFLALMATLRHDLSTKNEDLARATVSLIARNTAEELARPMRAESEAPGQPSKLEEAQRAVEELRRCAARWQNALNDGFADLVADLEYDLHDRTRKILREVDEAFDSAGSRADPLDDWAEFADWLDDNLFEAAEANYGWMVQRGHLIIKRVADNFPAHGYGPQALPEWSVKVPVDLGDQAPPIDPPGVEQFTLTQKLFTGLRGSYGGILMVGLATSLAGMPLINPYSLGAGAIFGGKTIFDESRALLRRRQAAAKAAAQRHVDDFFLRFSKDRRDAVRHLQRTLREHYTAVTEELQTELVDSFRSAKQAADAEAGERQLRVKQIAVLEEQARALVTG